MATLLFLDTLSSFWSHILLIPTSMTHSQPYCDTLLLHWALYRKYSSFVWARWPQVQVRAHKFWTKHVSVWAHQACAQSILTLRDWSQKMSNDYVQVKDNLPSDKIFFIFVWKLDEYKKVKGGSSCYHSTLM